MTKTKSHARAAAIRITYTECGICGRSFEQRDKKFCDKLLKLHLEKEHGIIKKKLVNTEPTTITRVWKDEGKHPKVNVKQT